MTAPQRGGPPEKEAAPASARATATIHTTAQSSCSVAEWKRRRAASQRLAILDCGRADPWHYDGVPLTEHQAESWQRTVDHLRRAGFQPIVPVEVEAVLR
ncbi:hypothetical protein KV112_02705 [Mycolicibacter sp. MYC123]|uniref:Uncharacterized protein n=1 Tax=[Mycobacterium] zoologicum TaxID=2872311 RepID=A0ABU5YF39_9MYCO|nr:hypothetical protein [Mycolicibacter sp. MYC123]MEB3048657.1 hypothetical protein [Mycolicibacter sp. MYC123]